MDLKSPFRQTTEDGVENDFLIFIIEFKVHVPKKKVFKNAMTVTFFCKNSFDQCQPAQIAQADANQHFSQMQ